MGGAGIDTPKGMVAGKGGAVRIAALLLHDLVNARGRHTERHGQRVDAARQRRQILLAQHLTRMHRAHAIDGLAQLIAGAWFANSCI
jgi:RecA/RadA recombinase